MDGGLLISIEPSFSYNKKDIEQKKISSNLIENFSEITSIPFKG